MNREQYLKRLKELLSDISEAERVEALKYYEEYFEDANVADEEVIRQLGSAEEVAASIREELADKEIVVTYDSSDRYQQFYERNRNRNLKREAEKNEKKNSGISAALVVLLVICAPIILPLFLALVLVIFAVTMVVLSLLIVSSACVLAFGCAAVSCLVVACIKFFVSPWATGILFGACLFCLGLCFINILITMKLCTIVIPVYFKSLWELLSLPFRKKEAVAA